MNVVEVKKWCVILMSLIGLLRAVPAEFNCPSGCSCEDSYDYKRSIAVSCPKDKPFVTVDIAEDSYFNHLYAKRHNRNHMKVNCTVVDPKVYDILLQMDNSDIDSVEFIGCALPQNVSFGNGMGTLKELSFQNELFNAIGPFTHEHFRNLTEVHRMTIKTNTTHLLPNNIFDQMTSLKTFSLEVNNLNLSVVNNVTSLGDCYFGYNMKTLDTNAFKTLPLFWSLGLARNQFGRLTKQSFIGVPEIKEIFLNVNEIETIDSDIFADITNLHNVFMYDNRMPELPEGIFAKNKELRRFIMSCSNTINSLPNGFLKGLSHLHEAIIKCNVSAVPADLFEDSENLDIIDLSTNSLTTLPAGLFEDLSRVTKLDLSKNLLTILPSDLFKDLSSLSSLPLSGNRFTSVSSAIGVLPPRCTRVDLTKNLIADIQSSDLDIVRDGYVTIDLSDNIINRLSASKNFTNNNYRGVFEISDNPLDCSCANGISLMRAIRNGNPFSSYSATCATPTTVAGQLVSNIKIDEVLCGPACEFPCPSACKMTADTKMTKLIMDCSKRGLTEVPRLPMINETGFNSLELYIDNNNITKLPVLRTNAFNHIKKIVAKNNAIIDVQPENIPNELIELDLSNNRLATVHHDTLLALNQTLSLKTVLLADNPWVCDCRATEFVLFLNASLDDRFTDHKLIKCKNGEPMGQLKSNDMCPISFGANFNYLVGIAVLVVVCGIVAFVYYHHNLRNKIIDYVRFRTKRQESETIDSNSPNSESRVPLV